MSITKKIDLYNHAFPIAWCLIESAQDDRRRQELSLRLSEIIHSLIKEGLDDPRAIAEAAVAALKNQSSGI
jgi:hypothetical protein